ncbi:MAG: helix-turn-helix domain-containing protein [Deltaproteobacteria bacterium]|nr:helix-turn-helix domain-containing protein [Deltaproteobacteria bacterium]
MRPVSNPARRILAVLDFLTANPGDAFGLTELSRRLGLNKPTCHGILSTLARAGYLSQDAATRAYRLGPSILAAGSAASVQLPLLDRVREEMRSLGENLAVASAVMLRARDHYVIVDRFALPDPLVEIIHVGLRLPLMAPLGAFFIAWSSPAVFEAWFASAAEEISHGPAAVRARFARSIAVVRSRGFDVTIKTAAEADLLDGLRRLHSGGEAPDLQALGRRFATALEDQTYQLDEIDPRAHYAVSAIAAPVFGTAPHPELALTLGTPHRDLSGREILDFGASLVESARRVSEAGGGRFPPLPSA